MHPAGLTDPDPLAVAEGRRGAVLSCLQEAGQPLSIAEITARTGLHANTARFHLAALVEGGVLAREAEARGAPGRPRMLYSVRPGARGPRSYRLLAEMLTGLVGVLAGAATDAVDAGRAWGRRLVDRPDGEVSVDEAVARMNRLLDDIGFRPELRGDPAGEAAEVWLHHCPFREVAEQHTDVVCALHLGLMQGALDELQTSVIAASLDPLVTPDLCVAHLRRSEVH